MKNNLFVFVMCIVLSGCTSSNMNGKCVGFMDIKNPNKEYNISFWNVFIGIMFAQTVIVPLVVAAKYMECPTSK